MYGGFGRNGGTLVRDVDETQYDVNVKILFFFFTL